MGRVALQIQIQIQIQMQIEKKTSRSTEIKPDIIFKYEELFVSS